MERPGGNRISLHILNPFEDRDVIQLMMDRDREL